MPDDSIQIALAQIAPVLLDREATLARVLARVEEAASAGCRLVTFGEALAPGYPFWVSMTDGARFDSEVQKDIFERYLDQGVQIEAGHLESICSCAADREIAVYLGIMERAADRGGHSLYCSLVYIDATGAIRSVHRKLQPTFEERLVWAPGDGHGLRVHPLGPFTVGGLNCWENWMPLPRATLYGLGEDLHVAVWPGADHITKSITRFVAREGRSFVVSTSGLLRREDVPDDFPHRDLFLDGAPDVLANGGSCVAGPDGEWVVEPRCGEETLITVAIDHAAVRRERQNFDPAGHYSRPDVTRLVVDRTRQSTVSFKDS